MLFLKGAGGGGSHGGGGVATSNTHKTSNMTDKQRKAAHITYMRSGRENRWLKWAIIVGVGALVAIIVMCSTHHYKKKKKACQEDPHSIFEGGKNDNLY